MVDDDSVAQAYGLNGFPYWVVVNGDGEVAARVTGALTTDQIEQLVFCARRGVPSQRASLG